VLLLQVLLLQVLLLRAVERRRLPAPFPEPVHLASGTRATSARL
jgi:hypothetical protein